jgi:hypothetical protein
MGSRAMTNVGMTDQQAELFLLLTRARAWDLRGESIEIYFDWDGNPKKARTSTWTLSTGSNLTT